MYINVWKEVKLSLQLSQRRPKYSKLFLVLKERFNLKTKSVSSLVAVERFYPKIEELESFFDKNKDKLKENAKGMKKDAKRGR